MSPRIRSARSLALAMFLAIGFIIPQAAHAQVTAQGQPPSNLDERVRAVNFVPFNSLSFDQQRLIESYFVSAHTLAPNYTRHDINLAYTGWTDNKDWQAAEFMAMTHVLEQLYLEIDGQEVQLISLVNGVQTLFGDRSYLMLDKEQFEEWMKGNQKFRIHSPVGKDQSGRFHMKNRSQWGGSLHKGFDVQGFTSKSDLPRVQINYRYADGLADIDLDAYSPFLAGFIPNPKHLTYENSDPRYWPAKYEKKYGAPGYDVVATQRK